MAGSSGDNDSKQSGDPRPQDREAPAGTNSLRTANWATFVEVFVITGLVAFGAVKATRTFEFDPEWLFQFQNAILLSWICLIVSPYEYFLSKFMYVIPFVLGCLYIGVLVHLIRDPNAPPMHFFDLDGWRNMFHNDFFIIGSTHHFLAIDFIFGCWQSEQFYSRYTLGYNTVPLPDGSSPKKYYRIGVFNVDVTPWTWGRIIFSVQLFLTYALAPAGLVSWFLLEHFYFSRHKSVTRIDPIEFERIQEDHMAKPVPQFYMRFGDNFPPRAKALYKLLRGIVGVALMLLMLAVQLLLLGFCVLSSNFYYFDTKFWKAAANQFGKTYSSSPFYLALPKATIAALKTYLKTCFRVGTQRLRVPLVAIDRQSQFFLYRLVLEGWFRILNFATIVEYAGYQDAPVELFRQLQKDINDKTLFARKGSCSLCNIISVLVFVCTSAVALLSFFHIVDLPLGPMEAFAAQLIHAVSDIAAFVTGEVTRLLPWVAQHKLNTAAFVVLAAWVVFLLTLGVYRWMVPSHNDEDEAPMDVCVFGDGVLVTSYKLSKQIMNSKNLGKGGESLGWAASTSQTTFSDLTMIFRNTKDPRAQHGRAIVHSFVLNTEFDFYERQGSARPAIEDINSGAGAQIWRMIPELHSEKASDDVIYMAAGELMFYAFTGGQFLKSEREAYMDCVKKPFIFFPDWFNMMLGGHALEDKNLRSYEAMLAAFRRMKHCTSVRSAIEKGRHIQQGIREGRLAGNVADYSEEEVLKLIAVVFAIAGAAAPAKVAAACVQRLWKNQNYVRRFNSDKNFRRKFVIETARLDKAVPCVTVMLLNNADGSPNKLLRVINEQFARLSSKPVFTEKTPIHISIVSANTDPKQFSEEFNPNDSKEDDTMVWNGPEGGIRACMRQDQKQNEGKQLEDMTWGPYADDMPDRWCPGHDFSIDMIGLLAQRFAPLPAGYNPTRPRESKRESKGVDENKEDRKEDQDSDADDDDADDQALYKSPGRSTRSTSRGKKNQSSSAGGSSKGKGKGKGKGKSKGKERTDSSNDDGATTINNDRIHSQVLDESVKFADATDELSQTQLDIYNRSLDPYTNLSVTLMHVAMKKANDNPFRGVDMQPPSLLPKESFPMEYTDLGRFLGTWDEDTPAGDGFGRVMMRKVLNAPLWQFVDLQDKFMDAKEAIAWRRAMFKGLPSPNVVYDDLSTTGALVRLAFNGLAAQHTVLRDLTDLEKKHLNLDVSRQIKAFVNDVRVLHKFRVREPYMRYGAACYFDEETLRPLGIYWCHKVKWVLPGANDWANAMYTWRSSAFAFVTVVDHLINVHMIESNTLTTASRTKLSHKNPMRRFLKPFTFNNVAVNHQAAVSLISNHGLVHRIWAFQYDEFLRVGEFASMNYTFKPITKIVDGSMHHRERANFRYPQGENPFIDNNNKAQGEAPEIEDTDYLDDETFQKELAEVLPLLADPTTDRYEKETARYVEARKARQQRGEETFSEDWDRVYPMAHDVQAFWNVVESYVSEFLYIQYGNDFDRIVADKENRDFLHYLCSQLGLDAISCLKTLLEVLTQLVCSGTGYHEQVGQVSDYVLDPRWIGTKLVDGDDEHMPTVQNYTQLLVLTAVTGFRMPGILDDWSHVLPDGPGHSLNYLCFRKDLRDLMHKIDMRNQYKRDWPLLSYNPRNVESSVSV